MHILFSHQISYQVLKGDVQVACRDFVKQIIDNEDIQILKSVITRIISISTISLHIVFVPLLSGLKGRNSKCIQEEYPKIWRMIILFCNKNINHEFLNLWVSCP